MRFFDGNGTGLTLSAPVDSQSGRPCAFPKPPVHDSRQIPDSPAAFPESCRAIAASHPRRSMRRGSPAQRSAREIQDQGDRIDRQRRGLAHAQEKRHGLEIVGHRSLRQGHALPRQTDRRMVLSQIDSPSILSTISTLLPELLPKPLRRDEDGCGNLRQRQMKSPIK